MRVISKMPYFLIPIKSTRALAYNSLILMLSAVVLSSCATTGDIHPADAPSTPAIYNSHSHALYLYSRSRLAAHDGDYPTALNLLREAIEADPSSAFLHAAIAEIKLKIGQVQEAMEYIDKAIKLDPALREPYVMAGSIMATAGKDFEAASYL